ncbi:hypothetical protein [Xylocopilactobacillus apicola]|uniref:Uncharacterized protein n=1 Tax=Xylocopilactobacillus apicola TaxID=2932184 RepID=A0AAU9DCB0_9LACO|nr:hypothetical protein [Xylocopilactobacillus apicola]BDR59200.1 hypothetical protein XA3_16410 [Xylocopilactobacillus apicola]
MKADQPVPKAPTKEEILASKLKDAKAEAEKNRPKFEEDLKGVTRQSGGGMKEDFCGISMPEDQKISMITFCGLITKTSYNVDANFPRTHYRVFIEKVYDGDRSKEGTFADIEADGGKIKNSVYYEAYQQKSFIPAQLEQYTLIQTNDYDPAAPGDEILLTMPVKGLADGFCVGATYNI